MKGAPGSFAQANTDVVMASSYFPQSLELQWPTGFIEYLSLCVIGYLFIGLLLYVLVRAFPNIMLSGKSLKDAPRRVLLVVAHPDDECMFFGPTILSLLKQCQSHFYVMCLSTGNFDGKGDTRKQELWNSCTTMGILPGNISLLKHDSLRDDPRADWSHDLVGKLLLSHIVSHQIDTLITFDQYGISGHKNHRALYFSVAELAKQRKLPQYCTPYALESVNVIRKYVPLVLDIPLSFLMSSVVYVADWKQYCLLRAAMSQHASQLVWFRSLYLFFSRYLTLNTLHVIEKPVRSKKTN